MPADLTGNDYISIPEIRADCSINGINVLHGGLAGLIEWTGPAGEGGALLRPRILLDGEAVSFENAQWRRLDRWIPTFTAQLADRSTITGTICAPGGYPPARGFLLRIEAENRGRSPRELRVELDVEWLWSRIWVAASRPLPGANRIGAAGSALTLETDAGRGPALAITAGPDSELHGGDGDVALRPMQPGETIEAPNGSLLRARLVRSVEVKSNSRTGVLFHCGVGRERDGAVAAVDGMQRHGADFWLRKARLELSHILRPAQDHRWAEQLNRNLIFNRYYAVGRAIDDDRLYLVRSRSTTCPAPALLNEREALLWTLPALLISDPAIAREAMFRVFELASERSGEFMRYVDGGAFDAAFVLEQFLLHAWAIDYFVTATSDTTILDDPLARQVLLETDAGAFMRLHPQHLLAATELLPSGDVADYPYTTIGNALLWRFCDALPRLLPPNGDESPPRLHDAATEVAAALWQHCVSELDGGLVFVSSASLEGDTAIYDDPSFSLALLPFLGFCSRDDPIWRATMEFVRSSRYPLWHDGAVPGLSARSGAPGAHTAALCADLLTERADVALQHLVRLEMPAGVAAAIYDVETAVTSHAHHAALAGFLAWTLVNAAEPKDELAHRRKNRR